MRDRAVPVVAAKSNTSAPAWIPVVAICCLLLIGLLIAGTIILALIPLYLSNKGVDFQQGPSALTLSAVYASDLSGGRSLDLNNQASVGSQIGAQSGLGGRRLTLNNGDFLSLTAAARRRRQTINGATVTCERPTGLTGDVFLADFSVPYPTACGVVCRRRFLAQVQDALRADYRTINVEMNFTVGGARNVRLVFCSFLDIDSEGCTTETRSNIYTIDRDSKLYSFNPTTYNLTEVGSLNCSNGSDVYSIALQRNGILWVLFGDGSLYRYILRLGQCLRTSFSPSENEISLFSMTFLKSATSNDETLYVSQHNDPENALGVMNLNTFQISKVNNYSNLSTFADLAATRTSRLFGVFEVDPYTVAEINPSNAQILAEYPLNISVKSADPNYGFASYNNQFFFFEGNGTYADIHIVDISTNSSSTVGQLPQAIFSSSASSCLGT